jgi:Flp pilus assembly pilin Flp
MRKNNLRNSKGQTLVEYSLLVGIVIAFLLTMTPMVKRSAQGMVRVIADEVGYQRNAEQQSEVGLVNSVIRTRLNKQQDKREWYVGPVHSELTTYADTTTVNTNTRSNLGITPE